MGLLLSGPASPWVERWSHLLAPGATVLDVACGRGRHTRWFARRGHPVTCLDRSAEALQSMDDLAGDSNVQRMLADIENAPWPLLEANAPRKFGAVVVTNYLWRPLMPTLLDSLGPGAVLLYETFAAGNATVGKPSRADFLLRRQELLGWCCNLRIVAFEDGFCAAPARYVQRIAAIQPALSSDGADASAPEAVRYPLGP